MTASPSHGDTAICSRCEGSGYSNHPDSGEVCHACNGYGGVPLKTIDVFSHSAVEQAMQDAWNTICADTGHHPLDIRRVGKELYFTPDHWANLVAKLLFTRALASRAPSETAP